MTRFSRRQMLSGLALVASGVAGSALFSACSPAAPAAPTAAPAAPAPAAPAAPAAPTATTAPAAPTATTAAAAVAAPTATAAPAPTVAPTATAAAQAAPAPAASTIELWYQHPEWKDGMTGVVSAFKSKNPNVTLTPVASAGGDFTNKLQTALNAGIGPDLFQHPSRPQLDVLSATGQLLELTNRVDLTDWTAVAKEAETVKGKIWGVPGGKYTVGIAYHMDVWDKAGITSEPKTWAELTDAFNKLKAINVIPYSIAAKDGSLTYFNYIGLASSALGLEGFDSAVTGAKKLTDPDMVAVVQQMIDWSKFYQPNFVGTVYLESKALFATKKASAMDAGSSDYNGYLQIDPNLKLGFMYWPAPDADHKPCTNTGMEFQVGVNAKSKSTDAAVTFAAWLGTKIGGQAMSDNIKDLSVMQGVKSSNPLQDKMLSTPLDVPVWYERFSTQNVGQVWADKGQAPFEKKSSAADLAKLLQKSIDDQLAIAAKNG